MRIAPLKYKINVKFKILLFLNLEVKKNKYIINKIKN